MLSPTAHAIVVPDRTFKNVPALMKMGHAAAELSEYEVGDIMSRLVPSTF
jgi:hypothetical protein